MPRHHRKASKAQESTKRSKLQLYAHGSDPGGSKANLTTSPSEPQANALSSAHGPTPSPEGVPALTSPRSSNRLQPSKPKATFDSQPVSPISQPVSPIFQQVSPIHYDIMSEPTAALSLPQTTYSVRGLLSTSSFYAGGQKPWYRKFFPVVAAALGLILGVLIVAAIIVVRYRISETVTPTPDLLTCDTPFYEPKVHLESLRTTIYGKVTPTRKLRTFFGIPYAVNVSGTQRFRLAQAVTSVDIAGVFNATHHGPPCPQEYGSAVRSDEECLTLSVWAPVVCNTSVAPMAVLVVLASEWFEFGTVDEYDDLWEELALRGGVVVVTINHRLGIFGFLDSDNGDPPGNMGIHDAFLAVAWVADHIRDFHGDPQFLVGIGQGSGSYILSLDLFAEAFDRKRYFRRLILDGLSPTSLLPRSASLLAVATSFGCANTAHPISNVDCLRKASVTEIRHKMRRSPPLLLTPSCRKLPSHLCDDTLSKLPATLSNTEILCAYSKIDGWKLFDLYLTGSEYLKNYSALFRHMQTFFTGRDPRYSLEDLPLPMRKWLNQSAQQGFRDLVVAMVLRCPMAQFAKRASSVGATVYFYSAEGVENFLRTILFSDLVGFAKKGKMSWDEFSSRRRFLLDKGMFRATMDWPEDWCTLSNNLSSTVFS